MQGSSFSGAPQRAPPSQYGMIPDEATPMDLEDEEPTGTTMLSQAQKDTPTLRNPVVLFKTSVGMLTDKCPIAFYDPHNGGLAFGIVSKHLDTKCSDKFKGKLDARIIRATTHGFDENVTNLCIVNHFLPVPCHFSPLVAIFERVKCNTFTDSISSIRQLLFFRTYYYKVALDDAEHCKECEKAYHKIHGEATTEFFIKVDQILSQKEELGKDMAVLSFAAVLEEYQLQRIRAIEWNIMDMMKVPNAFRVNFLTPTILPPGDRLNNNQGAELRKNLILYLKKRKQIYAGGLQILMKNKLLDVHDESKMDMDEDSSVARSCQADKLKVLTLERDFAHPSSQKFKGWICMSTLESYMDFLDTPKELKK